MPLINKGEVVLEIHKDEGPGVIRRLPIRVEWSISHKKGVLLHFHLPNRTWTRSLDEMKEIFDILGSAILRHIGDEYYVLAKKEFEDFLDF